MFKWSVENLSDSNINLLPGIEMNISPSSVKTARFRAGENIIGLDQIFEGEGTDVILEDDGHSLKMKYSLDRKSRVWLFPVNSISRLETGFKSIYQGTSLTFLNPADLVPGEVIEVNLRVFAQ